MIPTAPEPGMRDIRGPGGTDTYYNDQATGVVPAGKMVLFDVSTALVSYVGATVEYLAAYAVRWETGALLYFVLQKDRFTAPVERWIYRKDDPFPALEQLVRQTDLVRQNGRFSETHGLPQNFGGPARILYDDGGEIHFADNQSPILTLDQASKIQRCFKELMQAEPFPLPAAGEILSVCFEEKRSNGGFIKALLTRHREGGTLQRQSCYDPPKVYESSRELPEEKIQEILSVFDQKGMLAWAGLPEKKSYFPQDKTITVTLSDGSVRTVPNDRLLPRALADGFFAVELELVTKN